jgi:hypothetical protein
MVDLPSSKHSAFDVDHFFSAADQGQSRSFACAGSGVERFRMSGRFSGYPVRVIIKVVALLLKLQFRKRSAAELVS